MCREINYNCLQFYHPPTKQFILSNTYHLDPTLAAGPTFDLSYDGGLLFNNYDITEDIHHPPGFNVVTKVWYKQSIKDTYPNYIQAKIISISTDHTSDLYTVKFLAASGIHKLPFHRFHESH